jgi:hypothetical protein
MGNNCCAKRENDKGEEGSLETKGIMIAPVRDSYPYD